MCHILSQVHLWVGALLHTILAFMHLKSICDGAAHCWAILVHLKFQLTVLGFVVLGRTRFISHWPDRKRSCRRAERRPTLSPFLMPLLALLLTEKNGRLAICPICLRLFPVLFIRFSPVAVVSRLLLLEVVHPLFVLNQTCEPLNLFLFQESLFRRQHESRPRLRRNHGGTITRAALRQTGKTDLLGSWLRLIQFRVNFV